MTTPEEAMFAEALAAARAGERSRARDLLTRLLKIRQDQPEYWLWMSAVVETSKERIFCLKEALRLDPDNLSAKRGLILAGALAPDPSVAVPAKYQKRNWKSQVILPGGMEAALPISKRHRCRVRCLEPTVRPASPDRPVWEPGEFPEPMPVPAREVPAVAGRARREH